MWRWPCRKHYHFQLESTNLKKSKLPKETPIHSPWSFVAPKRDAPTCSERVWRSHDSKLGKCSIHSFIPAIHCTVEGQGGMKVGEKKEGQEQERGRARGSEIGTGLAESPPPLSLLSEGRGQPWSARRHMLRASESHYALHPRNISTNTRRGLKKPWPREGDQKVEALALVVILVQTHHHVNGYIRHATGGAIDKKSGLHHPSGADQQSMDGTFEGGSRVLRSSREKPSSIKVEGALVPFPWHRGVQRSQCSRSKVRRARTDGHLGVKGRASLTLPYSSFTTWQLPKEVVPRPHEIKGNKNKILCSKTDWQTTRLSDWLSDCLPDWLTDWLVGLVADSLARWLTRPLRRFRWNLKSVRASVNDFERLPRFSNLERLPQTLGSVVPNRGENLGGIAWWSFSSYSFHGYTSARYAGLFEDKKDDTFVTMTLTLKGWGWAPREITRWHLVALQRWFENCTFFEVWRLFWVCGSTVVPRTMSCVWASSNHWAWAGKHARQDRFTQLSSRGQSFRLREDVSCPERYFKSINYWWHEIQFIKTVAACTYDCTQSVVGNLINDGDAQCPREEEGSFGFSKPSREH